IYSFAKKKQQLSSLHPSTVLSEIRKNILNSSCSCRQSSCSPFLMPKFLVVWLLSACTVVGIMGVSSRCGFEAMFNFGDSNSDTGGFWAAFPSQSGPFGMTYFKKPAGRASDGRLIVDFLAEAMGMPFLSPYLQSIGSDYRQGANFATLASTVLLPNTSLFVTGISPFSLAIQLNQMKQFKLQTLHFHSTTTNLPSPSILGKSLFTLYIGQNDFTSNLADIGIGGVKQFLPQVIAQIASTIEELYELGGRTFLVLNMAPVGCYPAFAVNTNSDDIDEFGCVISYNKAAMDYNAMLKQSIVEARARIPNASLVYVDTHSVLLDLSRHPTSHGLKHGTKACCGYGGGKYNFDGRVYCGNKKVINGKSIEASACGDPWNYVSWDGIHTTEAANKILALAILDGSFSDPHFPFSDHCRLPSFT
ncbi:GDSL esterase/lipase At4g01130, partial [Linum grandiflorum]